MKLNTTSSVASDKLAIEMMLERCELHIAHLRALSYINEDAGLRKMRQDQFQNLLGYIETDIDLAKDALCSL